MGESGVQGERTESQSISGDLFCMRGFGIALVVLVHVLGVDDQHGVRKLFIPGRADLRIAYDFIHSFNMAVMLIAAGVAVSAFGKVNRSLIGFLRKKLDKLVVPMLIWAPMLLLMQELSAGLPHGVRAWGALLARVPTAWFPVYAIFWFVHVLVWCTLLSWIFRRFAAPRLGRWASLVYLGAAIVMHAALVEWVGPTPSVMGEYVSLVTYWNRFFGLGLFIQPALAGACQVLSRRSAPRQVLVSLGLAAALVAVYAGIPDYELVCVINGPLGFCLLISLSVFLGSRAREGGAVWKALRGRFATVGSISMLFYLFHIYFVSGTRLVLEHLSPGMPLAVHLVVGWTMGLLGPWVIYLLLKDHPLFRWSIGFPSRKTGPESSGEQPRPEPSAVSSGV
ncbi:acyltransferase [Cystobacter fuscus]|uniref:Acyltransferase n=1 Tax=Cystobacter fuscus TaxID=43 RepID=A0A250J1J0_9BACT|nr:acyltransferase [Cystobacter fuscus]ATB37845.1 acyltransferase [Cystobacter fuscus]